MSDPDHASIWNEVRRIGVDLAGLGGRVNAIVDRVSVAERCLADAEEWQRKHEVWAVKEQADLKAAIAEIRKALEEGMTVRRSLIERIWTVAMPVLQAAALVVIVLIARKIGVHP